MNHLYQIIRGKTVFTVHEYIFGVRSANSMMYPMDDMSFVLSKIPHHFHQLDTIRGSDKTVKDAADYKGN